MNDFLDDQEPRSVAIIGGGISGLAAAYELATSQRSVRIRLYEGSGQLGGSIQTIDHDGFLVELGPDMFTTKEPAAEELCRRLGMSDRLIGTRVKRRGAFIVRDGKLIRVPSGMALMAPQRLRSILTSPLLSIRGRIRLLSEAMVRRRKDLEDESLQSFATRRFGDEAFQWLVQPMISGIYTADPTTLSMQATMHEFVEMERKYGSLIRATLKRRKQSKSKQDAKASGARYGLFVAPRDGMGDLVSQLASSLPDSTFAMNAKVDALVRDEDRSRWKLEANSEVEEFDQVIVATRAFEAAQLLRNHSNELADRLDSIPYASCAVAVLIAPRDQIDHSIDAFGFVVPLAEQRKVIAVSFANHKFDGRGDEDHVIMRVFIGGACQSELLDHDDEQLLQIAKDELADLIGLHSDCSYRLQRVVRWNRAMPQYTVGHKERVCQIGKLKASLPGIYLAGNAYDGVGIPACIASGQAAANAVLTSIEATA